MKQDECVSTANKQHSVSSFLFFANKFSSFFVFKMSIKKNFVEKF